MLENGHPEARIYPLGMVHDESILVTERKNREMVTQSNLMQATISAVLSKKGGEQYKRLVSRLNVHTVPFERPVEGRSIGDEEWPLET